MTNINKYDCIYCGMMAEDRDHVIPVSYANASRKSANWSKSQVVPACRECNLLLSNLWIPSISGRAAYIAGKLSERHKHELSLPTWTDNEIRKLGYVLAQEVRGVLIRKTLIAGRIAKALSVSSMSLKPEDVWDVEKEIRQEIAVKQQHQTKKAAINQAAIDETQKIISMISKQTKPYQVYALTSGNQAYLNMTLLASLNNRAIKNFVRKSLLGRHINFQFLAEFKDRRIAQDYVSDRKNSGFFLISDKLYKYSKLDGIK
jgi:hypothetical protein